MPARNGTALHCVGTGFVALDIIRRPLDENTTLERRHAGGSCGNVLAILAYLGVRASAVGRIGDDPAGQELLADLGECGVDTKHLVAEKGRRTPIVIQESFVDARGRARHRFLRACPQCGAAMPGYRPLLTADVEEVAAALPSHTLFFFDRVAPGTLELARRSRERGALVLFEPSGVKDEKLFVECLRVSDILKYSHERLSGIETFVARARPALEVETYGAAGLRYRVHRGGRTSEWIHLPACTALSIRDSAGSGDWCTAGFLARVVATQADRSTRLADRNAIRDALRFGQALAALNCSYDGARGLMYAMEKQRALRAAERLLTDAVPKLPQSTSAPAVGLSRDRTCLVCSTDLRPAQA